MSDYTFKIDETHSVYQMNGFDIMVGKTSGSLYDEFCRDQSVAGPLREIYWDESNIYLKHAGRKQRNAFSGDTFLQADDTTNLYYTLKRHTDDIAGPFDLDAFSSYLEGIGHPTNIPWKMLSQARKESLRKNPFQQGVWIRMAMGICQLPGMLIAGFVCYVVLSCPILIFLLIARRVRRANWDIGKWWKRGLIWVCWFAISVTVAWAVFYAYM